MGGDAAGEQDAAVFDRWAVSLPVLSFLKKGVSRGFCARDVEDRLVVVGDGGNVGVAGGADWLAGLG